MSIVNTQETDKMPSEKPPVPESGIEWWKVSIKTMPSEMR
jgi:hypothetical protein